MIPLDVKRLLVEMHERPMRAVDVHAGCMADLDCSGDPWECIEARYNKRQDLVTLTWVRGDDTAKSLRYGSQATILVYRPPIH